MNELQLIKQQANLVIQSVNEIEKLKNEVIQNKNEVMQIKTDFQKDIDEIRSTYPLNRGEALLLKNNIHNKASELTSLYFGDYVSKELYGMKRVHLSIGLGHQLKKAFNAVTYNTIRHLDYEDAMKFVSNFSLEHLPAHYLRLTEKQLEVSERNGDGFDENFRGANIPTLKLVR